MKLDALLANWCAEQAAKPSTLDMPIPPVVRRALDELAGLIAEQREAAAELRDAAAASTHLVEQLQHLAAHAGLCGCGHHERRAVSVCTRCGGRARP